MDSSRQNASSVVLGIIGGSGVYGMKGMEIISEREMDTPYGKPSDLVVEAQIDGRTFFFIPRHGSGHSLTPAEVPYKANIHALKQLGVTHLLAVSAVGIMKEEIHPGEIIIPDQIFDRTKGNRDSTFFGEGVVGHVSFADPFCEEMRQVVIAAAKASGAKVHTGGAYICMEGPAFSTRSESHFYRKTLSPAVIGMTAIPEAKLAREAEMSYAMAAMATDYDCWHESEADVDVEAVMEVLHKNGETALKIVTEVTRSIPETSSASSLSSARFAIVTNPEKIPVATRKKLEPLYGKYWNGSAR